LTEEFQTFLKSIEPQYSSFLETQNLNNF